MDTINTLIKLNETKKSIEDLIDKVRNREEDSTDNRKLLIIILSVIGGLVVIGLIAYAVYKRFADDGLDDYELLEDEDYDDEADYGPDDADDDDTDAILITDEDTDE